MEQKFLKEVENDLLQMGKNVDRDFRMRAGNIFDFAPLEIDTLDWQIRPGLVFLMTKLFSGDVEKIQPLASVIQFIHLANKMHYGITDFEDKFKPQYPALIGDYLFSKFFSYLSLDDSLEFLEPLSQVICEIHVAGILRKEKLEKANATESNYLDVLEKEQGLLMTQACLIPALRAGVSSDTLEHVKCFGRNVGLAWGIIKEENSNLNSEIYITKARETLPFFPSGEAREALQNLLDVLEKYNI